MLPIGLTVISRQAEVDVFDSEEFGARPNTGLSSAPDTPIYIECPSERYLKDFTDGKGHIDAFVLAINQIFELLDPERVAKHQSMHTSLPYWRQGHESMEEDCRLLRIANIAVPWLQGM
jgi:hypothetical protein